MPAGAGGGAAPRGSGGQATPGLCTAGRRPPIVYRGQGTPECVPRSGDPRLCTAVRRPPTVYRGQGTQQQRDGFTSRSPPTPRYTELAPWRTERASVRERARRPPNVYRGQGTQQQRSAFTSRLPPTPRYRPESNTRLLGLPRPRKHTKAPSPTLSSTAASDNRVHTKTPRNPLSPHRGTQHGGTSRATSTTPRYTTRGHLPRHLHHTAVHKAGGTTPPRTGPRRAERTSVRKRARRPPTVYRGQGTQQQRSAFTSRLPPTPRYRPESNTRLLGLPRPRKHTKAPSPTLSSTAASDNRVHTKTPRNPLSPHRGTQHGGTSRATSTTPRYTTRGHLPRHLHHTAVHKAGGTTPPRTGPRRAERTSVRKRARRPPTVYRGQGTQQQRSAFTSRSPPTPRYRRDPNTRLLGLPRPRKHANAPSPTLGSTAASDCRVHTKTPRNPRSPHRGTQHGGTSCGTGETRTPGLPGLPRPGKYTNAPSPTLGSTAASDNRVHTQTPRNPCSPHRGTQHGAPTAPPPPHNTGAPPARPHHCSCARASAMWVRRPSPISKVDAPT